MGTRWLCGEGASGARGLAGAGGLSSRGLRLLGERGKWWYRDRRRRLQGAQPVPRACQGPAHPRPRRPVGAAVSSRGQLRHREAGGSPSVPELLSSGAGAVPLQGVPRHCSALCCFTLRPRGCDEKRGGRWRLSDRVGGGGSWEEVTPERSCRSAEGVCPAWRP